MLTLKKRLSFYKTKKIKKFFHLGIRGIAKLWLSLHQKAKIVGVVGSYGKTTTSQLIYQFLSLEDKAIVTDINLDTIYNLPLTILRLRSQHHWLILEMGIDHRNEMDFHLELAIPHLVVFTGISPVHADKNLLGSLKGIIEEKGKAVIKTIKSDGWAVINGDDPDLRRWVKKNQLKKVIWYGINAKNLDWKAEKIKMNKGEMGFEIVNSKKNQRLKLKGKFWGEQFIYAFLTAAAVGDLLGVSLKKLSKISKNFKPLSGRMSFEKGPRNCLLINDSLRANPASTKAGLKTVDKIQVDGRKIAVLGEMGELGKYAKSEHQKIGRLIKRLDVDVVIGIGPLLKETEKIVGKSRKFHWVADPVSGGKIIQGLNLNSKDLLYLKGSRLKHMERLLMILRGEKVGCKLTSCHFYHHCSQCPQLKEN